MGNQELINELVKNARAAMEEIKDYDQAQIDKIVKAMGKASYDNAEMLAQLAVDEGRLGSYESKIFKNRKSPMAAWYFLKDKKSMGVIDEDKEKHILTFAKPAGVIACIIPSTNPSATVMVNCMHAVKGKNAVIVAPHPRTKKTTSETTRVMVEVIEKLGAPKNLLQVIENPTIELTQELMKASDLVTATGGSAMVKAAYSSGKPALGVGQGNVQVMVAPDYKDFDNISTILANDRSYDYGMLCLGEQAVHVPKEDFEAFMAAAQSKQMVLFKDKKDIDTIRGKLFEANGAFSRDLVGVAAPKVAEYMGLDVPGDTRVMLIDATGMPKDDPLRREILCPILKIFPYDNFDDALQDACYNLMWEGAGHTSVVYTNDSKYVIAAGEALPVCRMVVNQASVAGGGSAYNNGLDPCMSIGCGFWGNNSITDNMTYKHMLNITRVSSIIPDAHIPTPEEVWGE